MENARLTVLILHYSHIIYARNDIYDIQHERFRRVHVTALVNI